MVSDGHEEMVTVSTDVCIFYLQGRSSDLTVDAAIAFAYIQKIMNAPDKDLAVVSTLSQLHSTLSLLDRAGFQRMVYEDFYDVFVGLINQVVQPAHNSPVLTPESLLEAFQVPESKLIFY